MLRIIRPALIVLLALMTGLAGYALGNITGWTVPKRTLAEQVELLSSHVEIRVPEDARGAVPAIILFHGCGGLRGLQTQYADAVLEAGYGAVLVDSNAARGLGRFASMSQVCLALRLWGQERAADVHAAIALADEHPGIDANRLVLSGWSHGGWTVLDALGASGRGEPLAAMPDHAPRLADHVKAALLIYPYCGFPMGSSGDDIDPAIPVHAILAENDLIAPHRDCVTLLDRAGQAGVPVEFELWPDTTHAFDDPDQPADPRMEYNAGTAEEARARMIEVLEATFAAPITD